MWRRNALLLSLVPCALLLTGLRPPDDAAPCPNPFKGKSWMWHLIPNVGEVKLKFNPPQYIQQRQTPTYVLYVPSSIEPAKAPDGRAWLAEGPYWAQCIPSPITPGFNHVIPVSFEGTVWPGSPPAAPPGGGGGGGAGGGDEDADGGCFAEDDPPFPCFPFDEIRRPSPRPVGGERS